jgi:Barrel-sandwich domain of CusB or HlyD membrane-fusion
MSAIPSAASPVRAPELPAPGPAPAPPKRSRLLVLIAALFVAAGVFAAYRLWIRPASETQPGSAGTIRTAKAFAGPFDVTLRLAGETAARNFVEIRAPRIRGDYTSLTLLKLATPGSWVKKGDLVAAIDAQGLEDHIDDLKDTIQQAENDIGKRKAEQAVEWETTLQTLRVAKGNYDKAQLDYSAAEVQTPIEQALLKLSRDEAEAAYHEDQKNLPLLKVSEQAEIRILQLTAEQHRKHIARHEHDLKLYTSYAPMPGLVVMANIWRGGDMGQVQQGDNVWPGQQVLKIVDTRSMQVRATVNQVDAGRLRIGQSVRVGFDAFPGMKFDGRIYSIGALAAGGGISNDYVRTVPVDISIDGSDPRLIPDLSAYGDVILSSAPERLQVPIEAVHHAGDSAWVFVKSAAQSFEKRMVTVGRANSLDVAVLGGLRPGDIVRLN